ncbi:hypothetical protein HYDPIDRAFT_29335 [Hydnomerulius pinastri MD-312]|uniref:Unplaced genomic scaffold scaffold_16, whole genome shotgun sequence n=1 Tax=Hydnomerulius pinastri MD-312 TaxID=994086 RepID=A0A0C9VDA4_9AGAM|nr:hypothetical protein HYDPIDRAFT_29335 [Hydnomerulius pinastri MD-312]
MFANVKTLAVVAACAVAAQAQSSASTTSTAPASQSSLPASIDTCILGCVTEAAASGGCSSFTDLQCVCTSTTFQSAALQCLQSNCTAADVTAATQLQQQECASIVGSSSGSASGSAPASTATSASTSPSPTTSTGAAVGLAASLPLGGVFGTLVVSAGALLGAAFVL